MGVWGGCKTISCSLLLVVWLSECGSDSARVKTAERRVKRRGGRSPWSQQGDCSGQRPCRQVLCREKTSTATSCSGTTAGEH